MEDYNCKIHKFLDSNKDMENLFYLKTGRFKQFREEFYAMYLFSKSEYCNENDLIKIVIGNQNYDAIIKRNCVEEKYEITGFIYGKVENETAKKLIDKTYSDRMFCYAEGIDDIYSVYYNDIINNIINKSNKNYYGINLIIIVDIYFAVGMYRKDTQPFLNSIKNKIKKIEFSNNKIYLIDTLGDKVNISLIK